MRRARIEVLAAGGKTMRVERLMTKEVRSCGPDDTLEYAAQLMWDHDCGSLPVCSGGTSSTVGMITDRDIAMCAMFHSRPLRDLSVSEAMARNPRTCRPTDSIKDAERIMREARIRRLPVVDANGRLMGMLTLADLACEAAREHAERAPEISEAEVGDTLAAICTASARRVAAA
jgi:CBS domain-containing protein